jgi:small subunit ribosomal protein S7
MPRRGRKIAKRELESDPKYGEKIISKFINKILLHGKKNVARKIMYESLRIVGDKAKDDPIKILKKAIDNVKPLLEVKSRRVGGATYQVPIEVRQSRGETLAIQWILQYSGERSGRSLQEKMADEIVEAYAGKGASIKKREDVHKMAEANKAFAHYRW